MKGDFHAGFCESRGVRFPPATHQTALTGQAGPRATVAATTSDRPPPHGMPHEHPPGRRARFVRDSRAIGGEIRVIAE